MQIGFKKMVSETYLLDAGSTLKLSKHEFFDTLTAYANLVLSGVAKTDLSVFWTSQKTYDALSPSEKLHEHAWLVDTGVRLPAASAPFEPMAGMAIWGASCWGTVAAKVLRGETLPPPARKAGLAEAKLAS
jgi:hypothetical protein